MRATATATESGLQALLTAPPERDECVASDGFWRRLNRGYVAAVLILAAAAGCVWAFIDPSRIVQVVTAVLIVTCPCALGIATPLAFDLALARLRRVGVFVRRAALLTKARHIQRIVFDKTGTLTWGGVRVTSATPCPEPFRDVLFTMAASSNHPVSRAIAQSLGAGRFLGELSVEDVAGRGLVTQHAGAEFRLGSPAFALRKADPTSGCAFVRDGELLSRFDVEEDFRAGAARELSELSEAGFKIEIASGDRPDRVARAARTLGLPDESAHGGLSPEDKAEFVLAGGAEHTLMLGDGLNDALAFEAAACAGTPALDRPAMPGRADFFYLGAGVGAVSAVLDTAHRLHAVVRQNLWLAAIYNAVAVTLSIAGLMAPWLVAVLMPISSIALIANALRGLPPRSRGEASS